MTALSNSQIFEPVSRDRLFFDQYRYSMGFYLRESGRMRSLDRQQIVERCAYAGSMWQRQRIPSDHLQTLLGLADIIDSITEPFKRVVFVNHQFFYTNNPEIFPRLAAAPGVSFCHYGQAQVDRPRDVVLLTHSQHKWRTFFRERYARDTNTQLLAKFLLARPEQYRITATWQDRLAKKNVYITSGFFVDHHDPGDALMLNMIFPGCVRKTLPIQINHK